MGGSESKRGEKEKLKNNTQVKKTHHQPPNPVSVEKDHKEDLRELLSALRRSPRSPWIFPQEPPPTEAQPVPTTIIIGEGDSLQHNIQDSTNNTDSKSCPRPSPLKSEEAGLNHGNRKFECWTIDMADIEVDVRLAPSCHNDHANDLAACEEDEIDRNKAGCGDPAAAGTEPQATVEHYHGPEKNPSSKSLKLKSEQSYETTNSEPAARESVKIIEPERRWMFVHLDEAVDSSEFEDEARGMALKREVSSVYSLPDPFTRFTVATRKLAPNELKKELKPNEFKQMLDPANLLQSENVTELACRLMIIELDEVADSSEFEEEPSDIKTKGPSIIYSQPEPIKLSTTAGGCPGTSSLSQHDSSMSTASSIARRKLVIRGLKNFKESRGSGAPPTWVKEFPCRSKFHPERYLYDFEEGPLAPRRNVTEMKKCAKHGGRCTKCGIYTDDCCGGCAKCESDCACPSRPRARARMPDIFAGTRATNPMDSFEAVLSQANKLFHDRKETKGLPYPFGGSVSGSRSPASGASYPPTYFPGPPPLPPLGGPPYPYAYQPHNPYAYSGPAYHVPPPMPYYFPQSAADPYFGSPGMYAQQAPHPMASYQYSPQSQSAPVYKHSVSFNNKYDD